MQLFNVSIRTPVILDRIDEIGNMAHIQIHTRTVRVTTIDNIFGGKFFDQFILHIKNTIPVIARFQRSTFAIENHAAVTSFRIAGVTATSFPSNEAIITEADIDCLRIGSFPIILKNGNVRLPN